MRAVVQRVHNAVLTVDNKEISRIEHGLLVMVGVVNTDDVEQTKKLAYRIATTRVFKDENDKLNKNVSDVGGSVMLVSNFTLCATKKGGTRPDFSISADKTKALELYLKVKDILIEEYKINTVLGAFAEHMHVNANLDGTITLFFDMGE